MRHSWSVKIRLDLAGLDLLGRGQSVSHRLEWSSLGASELVCFGSGRGWLGRQGHGESALVRSEWRCTGWVRRVESPASGPPQRRPAGAR